MSDRVDALVARMRDGDVRALARLVTIVENGDLDELRSVTSALEGVTPKARVIGVTGAPGVGKSTLVDAVVGRMRADGQRVAVIAVDPSSPFTGGALLGDRVRMQSHHDDTGVFIRSMAARGHLGGCAVATPQVVRVVDAAGFDVIVVETVGVGQSEVEIAGLADTTVVVVAPGLGDGIQAAKAGILEIADVYVINKADQAGAGALEAELTRMLSLDEGRVHDSSAWQPPIIRTAAVRGERIDDLVEVLAEHHGWSRQAGVLQQRRTARARELVLQLALERLHQRLRAPRMVAELDELGQQVADGVLDPHAAADRLIDGEPVRR